MIRTPLHRKTGLYRRSIRAVARSGDWRVAKHSALERQRFACWRCGKSDPVHAHHRLPKSQGGKDTPENCLVLCLTCHVYVHDHPTESYATGAMLRREGV